MSAASFLGIAGLVALSGFDGLIYSVGFLVGWPIVMFLIAEPLRNLGRYTFADVVAVQASPGAGPHCRVGRLAGGGVVLPDRADGRRRQPDSAAVSASRTKSPSSSSATVMLAYVLFGGMIATTWVQIVKAVLLLGGASMLALLVLVRFSFNPLALFAQAAANYGAERAGAGPPGHQSA